MKRKILYGICVIFIMAILSNINVFARTDFQPAWPLKNGFNISALDVYQSGSAHGGIDIGHGNDHTQPVYAVADGVVHSVGNKCSHKDQYPHKNVSCDAGNLGNFVTIKHTVNGKTFYSQYGHLTKDSIVVSVGQKVSTGTKIGKMGSSGNSTGPHLHLCIYENNWSNDKAKRTFDYYKDNSTLMTTIKIRKKLANVSNLYGSWIKSNGTLKNELYHFSNIDIDKVTKTKPVIDVTQYPTTLEQGKSFGLRGTISSENNVTSIKGYIVNSSGTTVMSTSDSPNSKSNNIRYLNLNEDMIFGNLSAGNYTLKIVAKDSSGGDSAVWEKAFSVKSKTSTNSNNTNTSINSDSSSQAIADGTYVISTKLNTNYVLDIADASKSNGANLQLWKNNGSSAQTFKVTHVGSGYYQIVNTNSGKAIDVQNGDKAAGTNVWQYQINNSDAQIWKIVSAGSGSYYIIGKGSGLYLDVDNAYADSGTNVKIFDKNDAYDAQKWIFIKVSSSNSSSTSASKPSKSQTTTTSIKFELESVPRGNLPYGKSFSLKGWFRSDSAIVEARAYMLDENKNVVMQSDKASSTTSNYKIQGYKLDKAMQFNKLSPGGYYLKYYVKDADGDTATWISDIFYIVK